MGGQASRGVVLLLLFLALESPLEVAGTLTAQSRGGSVTDLNSNLIQSRAARELDFTCNAVNTSTDEVEKLAYKDCQGEGLKFCAPNILLKKDARYYVGVLGGFFGMGVEIVLALFVSRITWAEYSDELATSLGAGKKGNSTGAEEDKPSLAESAEATNALVTNDQEEEGGEQERAWVAVARRNLVKGHGKHAGVTGHGRAAHKGRGSGGRGSERRQGGELDLERVFEGRTGPGTRRQWVRSVPQGRTFRLEETPGEDAPKVVKGGKLEKIRQMDDKAKMNLFAPASGTQTYIIRLLFELYGVDTGTAQIMVNSVLSNCFLYFFQDIAITGRMSVGYIATVNFAKTYFLYLVLCAHMMVIEFSMFLAIKIGYYQTTGTFPIAAANGVFAIVCSGLTVILFANIMKDHYVYPRLMWRNKEGKFSPTQTARTLSMILWAGLLILYQLYILDDLSSALTKAEGEKSWNENAGQKWCKYALSPEMLRYRRWCVDAYHEDALCFQLDLAQKCCDFEKGSNQGNAAYLILAILVIINWFIMDFAGILPKKMADKVKHSFHQLSWKMSGEAQVMLPKARIMYAEVNGNGDPDSVSMDTITALERKYVYGYYEQYVEKYGDGDATAQKMGLETGVSGDESDMDEPSTGSGEEKPSVGGNGYTVGLGPEPEAPTRVRIG